jgi:hypothetical protein
MYPTSPNRETEEGLVETQCMSRLAGAETAGFGSEVVAGMALMLWMCTVFRRPWAWAWDLLSRNPLT